MEFLFYIVAFILVIVVYGAISVAIFDKFLNSHGLSRIFWFFIMIGTLSFLLGSDGHSNSSNNYGGDDDYNFFGDDSSDSNSCSWDSSDSSWDCDD